MNLLAELFVNRLHFSPDIFAWIILPVIIFFARVTDVSLGTLRIIFVSRGRKFVSALLGFFEVLIWLLVMGQVMQNMDSIAGFFAYSLGYATGNYVGVFIEEKMAMGFVLVRVITQFDAMELTDYLRSHDYGVTSHAAVGATGEVKLLFTIVKRRNLPDVLAAVQKFNPRAFVSIEDVRRVSEGVFPESAFQRRQFDTKRLSK